MFAVITVCILSLAHITDACSPINFPKSVGFEATMYNAPVVIAGKAVQILNETHDTVFTLDCIYKQGNKSNVFHKNITVDGRYHFNSCTTTFIEINKSYIVALNNMNERNSYDVYEANIASSAAYEENEVNIEDMLVLCGFNNVTIPEGSIGNCKPRTDPTAQCQDAPLPSNAVTMYISIVPMLFISLFVYITK